MTNGHDSESHADLLQSPVQPRPSESDHTDTNDIPTTTISSSTAAHDDAHSDDDAIHDMATSELDEDEDAPGEVDAEFDEETPPHENVRPMDHDRSSSESSSRPGKRKSDIGDEELYMKQNPELYGLRRSVRTANPHKSIVPLTHHHQGRARPSRRVVCAA